jgi:hypothetical protein
VGLVNKSTGSVKGIEWSAVSLVDGNFSGIQYSYIYNQTKGIFTGWQNAIVNQSGTFTGLATGIYNQAETVGGVQLGAVNNTKTYEGLQLGIVNLTESMNGLQIGLINVIKNKESWSILPIVNWSF